MKKERNEGNEKFGTDREFGGDGTCAFSPRKSFLGKSCTCARRKCDVKLTKCNGFRGKRSRAMKRRLDEGGGGSGSNNGKREAKEDEDESDRKLHLMSLTSAQFNFYVPLSILMSEQRCRAGSSIRPPASCCFSFEIFTWARCEANAME